MRFELAFTADVSVRRNREQRVTYPEFFEVGEMREILDFRYLVPRYVEYRQIELFAD
jgi:hypothetical protein